MNGYGLRDAYLKMDSVIYDIREIRPEEYPLLDDFLYEAIYIPENVEVPPRDIIEQPELQVYVEAYGKRDDNALQLPSLKNIADRESGQRSCARCFCCCGKGAMKKCLCQCRRPIMR